MIPDLNVNKETVQHLGETICRDCLFKAKTGRMLSLVFKKQNLCPVMPASRGVNLLATSHTVERFYRGLLPERQSHGHGASCFSRSALTAERLGENRQERTSLQWSATGGEY